MQPDTYKIAYVNTGTTFLIIPNNGTTAASPFDCKATPPLAFITPSNWLACNVTVQVMGDIGLNIASNSQLVPMYDTSNTPSVLTIATAAGAGYYYFNPVLFNSVRYINLTSSVSQTNGPNTVYLVLPPLWQGIHS